LAPPTVSSFPTTNPFLELPLIDKNGAGPGDAEAGVNEGPGAGLNDANRSGDGAGAGTGLNDAKKSVEDEPVGAGPGTGADTGEGPGTGADMGEGPKTGADMGEVAKVIGVGSGIVFANIIIKTSKNMAPARNQNAYL
jgi:hypothetical protein